MRNSYGYGYNGSHSGGWPLSHKKRGAKRSLRVGMKEFFPVFCKGKSSVVNNSHGCSKLLLVVVGLTTLPPAIAEEEAACQ